MSDGNSWLSHRSLQGSKTIGTLLTALAKGVSKGEMTLRERSRS